MAKPKYKEFFELMIKNNKEEFENFRKLQHKYLQNPSLHQKELNQKGLVIQQIVYQWQDKLCNRSESTGYASFTSSLAEKFISEVQKEFPHFSSIGITVFSIPKIKLRK
jgi:phage-related protein